MKVVAFDLETGSAKEWHNAPYDYVRLCGWKTVGEPDTSISTNPQELIEALTAADAITGHNIIGFDLKVLAKWCGADYEALCRKSFDTFLVERHLNPIAAKGAQPKGYYKLGTVSMRYGGPDKVDEIDRLARKHKGFHLIPQDDPEYIEYLVGDVEASESLFLALRDVVAQLPAADQRYIRREHAVEAAMCRSSLEGFRVDVEETMSRWSAGQERIEASKRMMHEKYGMPLEGKKPHVSNLGKAAFRAAILDTGISEDALQANWPTGADGFLLTGKDLMKSLIEIFDRTKPDAAELCRMVLALNGERTVAGTVLTYLAGDRVHPSISADQSSGRWSVTEPGYTVVKKSERGMFLPDEGEVLVAIDADQVDARGVAALCQDPDYMKLFEPGKDLHSEVAWLVFRDPACREEMDRNNGRCDCPLRQRAKIGAHGFSYGLGAGGLSKQLGVDMSVAREFISGMVNAFPVLDAWKTEQRRQAGVLSWGETPPPDDTYRILRTGYGRPVRVERNRAYTQSCALIGQGTTRDIMAEAILKLPASLRRKIRAVVHDEIVLSIPRDGAAEYGKQIARDMAFDFHGVAITFGCSQPGDNWAASYGY